MSWGRQYHQTLCEAQESPDKPLPDDIGNGGGTAWYIELGKNITEMTIDGTRTNDECSGNLPVSVTLCYQIQDFEFSLGKGEMEMVHARDSSPGDSAWCLLWEGQCGLPCSLEMYNSAILNEPPSHDKLIW